MILDIIAQSWAPKDGGPIYAETPHHADHFLVEPWNALSSLFIILPGLYFIFKLRGQYKENLFLAFCAPLLILGGAGSTLFHAFRSTPVFLVLDVAPTFLLFLAISGYLWYRVLGNWLYGLLIIIGGFALSFVIFRYLPEVGVPTSVGVNIAYAIRGFIFFLPVMIILIRTKFASAGIIISGLIFFILALVFRSIDKDATGLFPMGTHFLWHVATGVGGLLVAEYVYRIGKINFGGRELERAAS